MYYTRKFEIQHQATALHQELGLVDGLSLHLYHAQQDPEEKRTKFSNWLNNSSKYDVGFTTSAFGIGIKCPNARIYRRYKLQTYLDGVLVPLA
ncbi:hypothetical protein BDC45DRAFT_565062 [Circinella umbellata]|nr:hypothetical protein BDC45DRAFT_565062 [Circinella umbellata]